MAKKIPNTEYGLLLYDNDTGESCVTERIVDITEDSPGIEEGRKAILLFTRVSQGRVVQILHTFPGRKYDGTFVHFFIDKIEIEESPVEKRDLVFQEVAGWFGLTKTRLHALILENAPAE
jgi:hypothetical protein